MEVGSNQLYSTQIINDCDITQNQKSMQLRVQLRPTCPQSPTHNYYAILPPQMFHISKTSFLRGYYFICFNRKNLPKGKGLENRKNQQTSSFLSSKLLNYHCLMWMKTWVANTLCKLCQTRERGSFEIFCVQISSF